MSLVTCLLILIVAFLAGVEGILDEFQFHQPLAACTLVGLVSDYLTEGVLLGGYLQMMALGWANVGAAVAPDVALASIASSILMVHGLHGNLPVDFVISVSIAIAIPLSVIGLTLTKLCRTRAINIVQKMDQEALQADFKAMERQQLFGIGMQGMRVMLPALLLVLIPNDWIISLIAVCPVVVLRGLSVAKGLIPALGFAIVINVLASKETWVFFALGFILAGISSLSLVGVCIIGAAMMLIYMALKKGTDQGTNFDIDASISDLLDR